MAVEHRELGIAGGVAHRDLGGEAVALRFRERIGAFHLHRVLGGDDEERGLQRVRHAVDRDLPLLHALQQRRLGLRAGPVDLVADDHVGEHRAVVELEDVPLGLVDADPRHVARQQVRGELDTPDRARHRSGQCLGQHGLADARHVFDQQVTLGEQDHQGGANDRRLAVDDGLDRVQHPLADHADGLHIGLRVRCAAGPAPAHHGQRINHRLPPRSVSPVCPSSPALCEPSPQGEVHTVQTPSIVRCVPGCAPPGYRLYDRSAIDRARGAGDPGERVREFGRLAPIAVPECSVDVAACGVQVDCRKPQPALHGSLRPAARFVTCPAARHL